MKPTQTAILLLLLATPLVAAVPEPEGIVPSPEPPAVEPPNVDLDEASTGVVLVMDIVGMGPEMAGTVLLDGAAMVFETDALGDLTVTVTGAMGSNTATLPSNGLDDFTVLLTPATAVIDRPGTNPADLTPANIEDLSLNVWGLMDGFGTIAADGPVTNPSEAAFPPAVSLAAERIDLANPLDVVTELIVLDPDDNLVLGTLAEHTTQVPTTDTLHTTAGDIQAALTGISLDSLTLNGVLSSLTTSQNLLGIVDRAGFSTALEDAGMKLRIVDLPAADPRAILDVDAKELILVDGGLGKLAMLADQTKLAFNDDLVTGLKNPDAKKATSFVYANDNDLVSKTMFDHRLGNYKSVLDKVDPLNKRGVLTGIIPSGTDCKSILASASSPVDFCARPDVASITPSQADTFSKMKHGSPTLTRLPGGAFPASIKGTDTGSLREIPVGNTGKVGALSLPQTTQTPRLGEWKLPESGIGGVPGITAPNTGAVPDLSCGEGCLPSHDLTVVDPVYEAMSGPALPGNFLVVPVDQLGGLAGMVGDPTGGALGLVPVDTLQGLPMGLTAQIKQRYVGGASSVMAFQGLPGVSVTLTTKDPLGVAGATQVFSSNSNGWVTMPVPAQGTYTFVAGKENHESVEGAGGAPGPGQESSREYAMERNSGSDLADGIVNKSASLLLVAVAIGAAAFVAVKVMGRRKTRRGGRA